MSLKWFMYNLSIHEKTYSKKSVARPLNGFEPTAARKREADSDADLNPIRTRGVPIAPHERASVPAVSYSDWPIYRPLHSSNPVKKNSPRMFQNTKNKKPTKKQVTTHTHKTTSMPPYRLEKRKHTYSIFKVLRKASTIKFSSCVCMAQIYVIGTTRRLRNEGWQ